MTAEGKILAILGMLAEQSGEKVSPPRLEFMVRKLLDMTQPDKILSALEKLLESSRRFPTIEEIKRASGLSQTDEDKGREVGERIWSALSKFGSVNGNVEQATEKLQRIAEYLGPIGHDVVRMQGGWNNLCELATNDNAIALKAQWRELAEVITRKGGIGEAPDFARLPPNAAIAELCAKLQH